MFEEIAWFTDVRPGGRLGSQEKSVEDVTLYWFSKMKVNSGRIYGVPALPEGRLSTNVMSLVFADIRLERVGHDEGVGGDVNGGVYVYVEIPDALYAESMTDVAKASPLTKSIVITSFGLPSNQLFIELNQSVRLPASYRTHEV